MSFSVPLVQEQVFALRLAQEGHSFLLTGQAGTGKTAVVKEIMKCLTHWYVFHLFLVLKGVFYDL